jgi:hypothetical protein
MQHQLLGLGWRSCPPDLLSILWPKRLRRLESMFGSRVQHSFIASRCEVKIAQKRKFAPERINAIYEGHTGVVIEHHMAVAAEADWVIDIGPEAGAAGGTVVAQGAPETVAKVAGSRTAAFLAKQLG